MSDLPTTPAEPAPISLGDFAPLVGETFTLGVNGRAVPARLTEAKGLGYNRPATQGGRESFSLIFHAPASERLPQGIYDFAHPQLGTQAMFLVPLGSDASGMRLQVIFNFN